MPPASPESGSTQDERGFGQPFAAAVAFSIMLLAQRDKCQGLGGRAPKGDANGRVHPEEPGPKPSMQRRKSTQKPDEPKLHPPRTIARKKIEHRMLPRPQPDQPRGERCIPIRLRVKPLATVTYAFLVIINWAWFSIGRGRVTLVRPGIAGVITVKHLWTILYTHSNMTSAPEECYPVLNHAAMSLCGRRQEISRFSLGNCIYIWRMRIASSERDRLAECLVTVRRSGSG
jgi:hypothetical protein